MKKPKPTNQTEKGITLIALIVIIVMLVILSAVVIRGISGNEGLIKKTETSSEEYIIKNYKEQIREKVNSIIQTNTAKGEETRQEQIKKELEEETTWIKKVEETINSEENNDDKEKEKYQK